MLGPILCIAVPLLLCALASVFYARPGELLAKWLLNYAPTRRIITILLMGIGIAGGVCLDQLDVSDLFYADTQQTLDRLKRLEVDLEKIHNLTGSHLDSVKSQYREIISAIREPQSLGTVYVLALAVGALGGVYMLLSVYHTASEGVVAGKVSALEGEKARIERRSHSVWEVFRQVEVIAVAKWKRIERALVETPPPKNCRERHDLLCKALSPLDQIQSFVACSHQFFQRKDLMGARLVASLYLPVGDQLRVVASTDGAAANVITSPNAHLAPFFKWQPTPENPALVVKVFHARLPKIIPACTHENFTYFRPGQENEIKSVFACPLVYSNGTALGVLFAESDCSNYFADDEDARLILKAIGTQIALRVSLESCVRDMFTRLEASMNAEATETL